MPYLIDWGLIDYLNDLLKYCSKYMKVERLQLEDLRKTNKVVVIVAIADWDADSNNIKDTIEETKEVFNDGVAVGWTTDPEFIRELRASTCPCYTIYLNGIAVEKFVGKLDKDGLVNKINN